MVDYLLYWNGSIGWSVVGVSVGGRNFVRIVEKWGWGEYDACGE